MKQCLPQFTCRGTLVYALTVILLSWFVMSAARAFEPIQFFTAPSFPVGNTPWQVVTTDVDRDGHLDLVTANFHDSTIGVLRGYSGGRFGIARQYSTGSHPDAITAGDFNGDGWPDLATADASGWNTNGTISVLLNNRDGTFAPPAFLPVGRGPISLVTADFNKDGHLDLATAISGGWSEGNQVAVLLGSGDGTFAPPGNFSVGAAPRWLVTGDFDNDGAPDLAVANSATASISVLVGLGNGQFAPAVKYTTTSTLFYLTAADLNHDQRLDLVGAHYSTSGLSVWLARPDGTFSPAVTELPGTQVQAVTTGDYTGDTHPDLVTVNSTGSPLMLLPGRGDGTFLTPLAYNVAGGPGAILAGEFTGDAHLDVVTGNWHHNSVSLYPGNGDGTFQHTAEYVTAGGEITTAIKADFNRDGNLDLATLSTDTDVATILLGRGDGTFIEPAQFYDPGVAMHSIAAADLNGDGTLDLVTAGFDEQASSGGEFAVLLGSGDGTFTNQVSRVAYGNGANSVAVGDFNEDGKPDLVLVYYYEGKVSILEGTGTGTFNLKTNYLTSGGAEKVFTGDFNGDTHTDVLVGSGNALVMLPGKGDGSFAEASTYSAPGFHVMALGDINGDHHTDVATGWFDDTCVTVFVGHANGSFVNSTNYCQGNGADSVLLHDINGDDSLDLLVGNYYFSSVHTGFGNGTFGEQVVLPIEGPILEVGDYNNDRKPDLVVARGNKVGVVLNRTVPVLHVESDGDQVRLSWPDWPGYVLESSTNVFLSSTAVTNPPVKIGNQNVLTTPVSTTTTLYRLTTEPSER